MELVVEPDGEELGWSSDWCFEHDLVQTDSRRTGNESFERVDAGLIQERSDIGREPWIAVADIGELIPEYHAEAAVTVVGEAGDLHVVDLSGGSEFKKRWTRRPR
jgi:hypothetical protein